MCSYELRKDLFATYFLSTDRKSLFELALSSSLREFPLRGVAWKVFLNCLDKDAPVSKWKKQITHNRNRYIDFLSTHRILPHHTPDPQLNHPLSHDLEQDQNHELEKIIDQDIQRTYPELEFFRSSDVKDIMLRILFTYAKLNPELSYKQGMHEVLAPLIFILDQDKLQEQIQEEDECDSMLSLLCSPQYVEHDAFTLFSAVMEKIGPWFMSGTVSDQITEDPVHIENLKASYASSPIVRKSHHIQEDLLKNNDPELYRHLHSLGIEPQLYALRWLRLLLSREFLLEEVLVLWDAIFAYGDEAAAVNHPHMRFQILDYICLSMLTHIRALLIGADYCDCIKNLLSFPASSVSDVFFLVQDALSFINHTHHPFPSISSASTPSSSTSFSSPLSTRNDKKESTSPTDIASSSTSPVLPSSPRISNVSTSSSSPPHILQEIERRVTQNIIKPIANATSAMERQMMEKGPLFSLDKPHHDRYQQMYVEEKETNQKLIAQQTHMAKRLDRIVYSLQKELNPCFTTIPETNRDAIYVALAELKQLKDILSGSLGVPPEYLLGDSPFSHAPASAPPSISSSYSTPYSSPFSTPYSTPYSSNSTTGSSGSGSSISAPSSSSVSIPHGSTHSSTAQSQPPSIPSSASASPSGPPPAAPFSNPLPAVTSSLPAPLAPTPANVISTPASSSFPPTFSSSYPASVSLHSSTIASNASPSSSSIRFPSPSPPPPPPLPSTVTYAPQPLHFSSPVYLPPQQYPYTVAPHLQNFSASSTAGPLYSPPNFSNSPFPPATPFDSSHSNTN
eukprot:TRINITY_DN3545_c0_g1_i1.p1 TRINITY_DN3545_c0_g1~~TRINITY_DN3545_c0_g1_i1.p1  ORF type:complete len:793 (-),score=194.81 TRINITY_DN3545_c0_g1_i1:82-2460(-)